LAGTAAFFTFFLIARRYLKDNRVFFTATFFLLANPYFFWASRDARMYAFVVLAAALSTYLLLLDEERPQRRYLVGYAVVLLLGYNIHRLTACMLVPHLGMVLMRDRENRKRWLWLGAGLIAALVLITIPLFHGMKVHSTQGGKAFQFAWPDPSVLLRRWSALATTSFSTFDDNRVSGKFRSVVGFLADVGTTALLMGAFLRRKMLKAESPSQTVSDRYFWRSLVLWMVLPGLLLVLAGIHKEVDALAPRYFFMAQPALLMILAYGFWISLRGRWQWAVWTLRGVLLLALCGAWYVQVHWRGPGLRESARYAQQVYEEGDVVFSPGGTETLFEFYHLSPMKGVMTPGKKMTQTEFVEFIRQNTTSGHKAILFIGEGSKAAVYSKNMRQEHAGIFEFVSNASMPGNMRVDVFRRKP
ncbi:TPA: hypothetical protein DDW35_09630, partial [Candidatus Sumerlaeota bacterium]|nr:hypothetical protein [Candidatus Sumerlaeota bacterium]